MRLSEFQIKSIKEIAKEIFGDVKIILFGSRVDDTLKGGDIDLYLIVDKKPYFLDKPRFLAKLKRKIGEQKIDVVIDYPQRKKDLIDKEALNKGIEL